MRQTKDELAAELADSKTKAELKELLDDKAEGAAVAAEAGEKKLDETVPGGKYVVDGKTVNADGEEMGKKK